MKIIALTPLMFFGMLVSSCVGEEGIHQTKIYVSAQTPTVDVAPPPIDTTRILTTPTQQP